VEKTRVGVVGVGYLGQFHAEKYAKMKGVELAGVVDIDFARAREIAKRYRSQPFSHHSEILPRVQAVSIAVPTPFHHAIARDFLEKGVDVLLEKPISTTLQEADELIELAESHGRVLQIGHLERFSGPLLALEGVVQNPMFIESNRLGLSQGTEVDVVLDLMIHDIDIILSWVPSKVKWFHAVGIPGSHPILILLMSGWNSRTDAAEFDGQRVSREKMRKIASFSRQVISPSIS
jgi:predicted dehydrogenase